MTPRRAVAPSDPALVALADRIGYTFRDPVLLRQAVAHRSWCAEVPGHGSNERLEFLGDAVLGWVVADHVFRRHDELSEGQLTEVRKAVVNAGALAEIALEVDLGAALLLGKGEDAAGGRAKASILADALEAVIGAVYLDGGVRAARALIVRLTAARIEAAVARLGGHDHKTALQEVAARRFERQPAYQVSEDGPDHAKRFYATVVIDGAAYGQGQGRTKKAAEQAAAAEAVQALAAVPDVADPPDG